jgi:hypothetical protein
MRWLILAATAIAATILVAAHLGRPKLVTLVLPEISQGGQAPDLDERRIEADLRMLTEMPSRQTGSAGAQAASRHIRNALQAMGVHAVEVQDFETVVPVTAMAVLSAESDGQRRDVALHPLWPNLGRTGQTGPEGLTGPLIDLRAGTDQDLSGRVIEGALAIMNWDTDLQWLSVPEFSGQAVIFRGDRPASGFLARRKILSMPADIPRYYVAAGDVPALERLLSSSEPRPATLRCASSWERAMGQNILACVSDGGTGGGSNAKDRAPVIFHAYYDSISAVPGLAPGAEQAVGAAVLLELGRFFRAHAPGRPVYLLFTSGHGQAFAGMTDFVDRLRRGLREGWTQPEKESLIARMGRPGLFVGLDLSTQSDAFGVFCVGRFRGQYEGQVRHKFSTLGGQLSRFAETFRNQASASEPPAFIDAINLTMGRGWWTFFPYQAAFESELPTLAGFPGITLATVNDGRRYVDTPDDQMERLRLDLLSRQILASPGRQAGLANVARALTGWQGPYVSSTLDDRWAVLKGRTVWLDQRRNYTPNEPLKDAVVFLKTMRGEKHLMGTRGMSAAMTDAEGRFTFKGLIQVSANAQFRSCALEVYGAASRQFVEANPDAIAQYRSVIAHEEALDPTRSLDGSIVYAVDMARGGDYPWQIAIEKAEQHLNLVCFPCRNLTLLGLTDPRGYTPLRDLQILDASSKSALMQFGKSGADTVDGDPSEDLVTLWANPESRSMLTLGHGFQEKRLVLVNNSSDQPEGQGFALEELKTLPSMVLQGAQDMWNLNDMRIRKLERNGVHNPRIRGLHAQSESLLAEAAERLAARDYAGYRRASEKGWSLESMAYGEILSTINNMIHGVLFYLVLLLPLSYCLERLLIASGTIKRKLLWIAAIFAASFLVLAAVHPAFRFTLTPFLVLLAFIILALVVTVSVLVFNRMDAVLQERKRVHAGYHEEQSRRGGIAIRALDLGISNIRRRPQRGFLTGLSVVMVTFILLSFTSLVPITSISKLRHPTGTAVYRGLLTRDRQWKPLPMPLYDSLRRAFAPQPDAVAEDAPALAARGWFFSDQSGKLSQIDLAADSGRFTAVALLCLEPAETRVTSVAETLLSGRWFNDASERSLILSRHVAAQLGYTLADVGRPVRVFGEDLELVGIFDATRFDRVMDIDGEPLTPVNFVLQQEKSAQEKASGGATPDTLEEYIHYPSDQIAILPLALGHRLGAQVRSIAVRAGRETDVRAEAEGYARRSNLTILGSDGSEVTLYAALDTSQISAAWQIVIPVFLGFIMILGTMMGSVYERKGEIFVYNSVGLSPTHVSSLFMAESTVYAIVGAGMGYLLGQVAAKVLQSTGWLSGLSLNYTAGSAILVTAISMLIVMLSSVYPARQAFHAAIPDVERERMADAQKERGGSLSDTLSMYLPFVASPEHVLAMQAYMAEYLETIQGVTIGQLGIDGLRAGLEPAAGRAEPVLQFRAWMAPFDLGVSHDACLRIKYRPERGVHQVHLTATRFSGDHQNWMRLMPQFILAVRKQLLMWRVLSAEERQKYRERGDVLFGPANQAGGPA